MSSPASSSFSSSIPPSRSLVDIAKVPSHPNMHTLDRSAFNVKIPILSARVNVGKISEMRRHPLLRGQLMDLSRAPGIVEDPVDKGMKWLRLRVDSEDQLPLETREFLRTEARGLMSDVVELDYDQWSASEILNSILPPSGDDGLAPSSFTQTGHIGHVNLREEWLPYKHFIGQVFLDKNPKLRTIVNKLDKIHAQYRYFDMEILAGDNDFITTANEANCSFTFDFSRVYWNSRLHHEHERLVALLPPGTVVADVMAGVGPFVVPAAKQGCFVLGNDLNPEGVKWMRENRIRNKVEGTLRVSEMDGREFIRRSPEMAWKETFQPHTSAAETRRREKEARRQRKQGPLKSSPLPSTSTSRPQLVEHYIMNLPDSALEFLDAFTGLYDPMLSDPGFVKAVEEREMPMVHAYCFTREIEADRARVDICERATGHLGHPVTPAMTDFHLHLVRSVAPNKDMYCLSFRLPEEVALQARRSHDGMP